MTRIEAIRKFAEKERDREEVILSEVIEEYNNKLNELKSLSCDIKEILDTANTCMESGNKVLESIVHKYTADSCRNTIGFSASEDRLVHFIVKYNSRYSGFGDIYINCTGDVDIKKGETYRLETFGDYSNAIHNINEFIKDFRNLETEFYRSIDYTII